MITTAVILTDELNCVLLLMEAMHENI